MKKNQVLAPSRALRERSAERSLRLARLRRQVENGTYRPDLQAVAERLIVELRLTAGWH